MKTLRKKPKQISLPDTFKPRFWETQDGRLAAVKEINRRYRQLKKDTGADSYQKDLLCQEAAFMSLQLETLKVEALEAGTFQLSPFVQAVNSLLGILKQLGLTKKVNNTIDLDAYLRKGRKS